jgi:hypothetical protein
LNLIDNVVFVVFALYSRIVFECVWYITMIHFASWNVKVFLP